MLRWIRHIVGHISDWFREEELPVIHKPDAKPTQAEPGENADFAIFNGHTADAPGAYNYLGESEFSYYGRISPRIASKVAQRGYKILVFQHKIKSYSRRAKAAVKKLMQHMIRDCVFMHFNAYSNPSVQGFEGLLARTASLKDNMMAEKFALMMNEAFNIDLRGYKGTKTIEYGHSGGGMLYEVSNAGINCFLIETLFATHETPMTRHFFSKEGEEKFVNLMADFCIWVIEQD